MNTENFFTLTGIIKILQQEKVIAYPTEAVFGLGCDPDSKKAAEVLLALKQRHWWKGLILIAANYDQLRPYIDDSQLSIKQCEDIFSSWPGPVTWIFPAKTNTPYWLTGRFGTLAVRVTDHPLASQLCALYGKPLISTSANLSGCKPCRTATEVREQFGPDLPVLCGSVAGRANPSEIRDVFTGEYLRHG